MFEELPFILGFVLFSVVVSYVLLTYTPEQLMIVIQGISIVGIIIHELCHIFMCLITNTRIEKITLVKRMKNKKYGRKYGYGGEVRVRELNVTFLQAFLIGLAPLFFSCWLFFFLWGQISNPSIDVGLFYLYLFVMISIVFSSAPSFADLAMIPKAFQTDVRYSFYQILLLALSMFTTWLVIISYEIHVIHEVFTYITIIGVYYGLKYGFKGLGNIIYLIKTKTGNFRCPRKVKIKSFTRRRHKPVKPKKRW